MNSAPEDKYLNRGGGVSGEYDTSSPVYQAVHAEQSGPDYGYPNPGAQSRSFKMLQQMTESDQTDYSGMYSRQLGILRAIVL